jgi:predicted nucleic acid-binding protein
VVFADTGALFAFLVADDRHHPYAMLAEIALRAERATLWTIDPVLTELWLLLRREAGRELSDKLIAGLLDRGLRREPLQPESYTRAWELAGEWPDQDFSLTDRQAFAAIEHSGRLRAWSYDDDFAVIRFGPRRTRSLDLVR